MRMRFKISKAGLYFAYNNDEIVWRWWWNRLGQLAFWSTVYRTEFSSFREYWKLSGAIDKPVSMVKIRGYSTSTLINAWIKFECRVGYYVVLYDVNIEAKPSSFWRSIPDKDKIQLLSDVVLLKCKDMDEIEALCYSIDPAFAAAIGVVDGENVIGNHDT